MADSISLEMAVEAITAGVLRALHTHENSQFASKYVPEIWAGGRLALVLPSAALPGGAIGKATGQG
jgi:hypothetical protein